MTPSRVVVVGAGFAGLAAARTLGGQPVDVEVVDRHNFHTFQPLLYQVATAGLNPADVAYPVRSLFRRDGNVHFRRATVVGISDGEVVVAGGERLAYDHLVIAGGSSAAYFRVPGAAEHSYPLYELADATRLRNHVLRCFEDADAYPERTASGGLTFVVVGGGPTGVEMAGALSEVIDSVLRKDYRRAEVGAARVLLVEMQDTVLPAFGEGSRRHAIDALRERDVDIRLAEQVAAVSPRSVRLGSGEEIATRTVIWAAGVQASPIARSLGFEQTRGGRVVVCPDLSVPGRPNVFVAGDMAAATAPDGSIYPQLAPVAMQAGEHVARQVLLRAAGRPTERFVYRDKGIMATIGRRSAVAELRWGVRLWGTLGWFAWLFLHLLFLMGFRNRLSVLLNWVWNYLTWERGPRLILEADDAEPDVGDERSTA